MKTTEITPSVPTGTKRIEIRTEYDEQGRSYVVIDDLDWKEATVQDWVGGIPDLWKRR